MTENSKGESNGGKAKVVGMLPPILITSKYLLEELLHAGVAISVAIRKKKQGKLERHLKITNYDGRCKECMPEDPQTATKEIQSEKDSS